MHKSYKKYNSLIFNNKLYGGDKGLQQLIVELKDKSEEETYIADFIAQWINDNEYVSLLTSGSTGKPKQIRVAKSAMINSALQTLAFLELQPEASALLCLSAKYIAGKMMIVRALVGGVRLLYDGVGSNPLKKLKSEIDFVALVPLQLRAIATSELAHLSKAKNIIVGGGQVQHDLELQAKNVGSRIYETYGMTETVSHIALRKLGDKTRTFKVFDGIRVRSDERNCLIIEPSLVNDKRLVTNDIVDLLSPKEFVLKGRYDNVINSGGVKLIPEMIERKLEGALPFKLAVSWKDDAALGQKLVLVIESDVLPDIDETLFNGLTKFEKPKEILCLKTFPRTETGKIIRYKLQQLL